MIGVLIAAHGEMAQGMMNSLELIMGKQENYKTLALLHETSIEDFGGQIVESVNTLDQGNGVLIFTDLYAASPFNQSVLRQGEFTSKEVRIISGVNLPMLLESFTMRNAEMDYELIWTMALEAGKNGITEFKTEFEKLNK